MIPKRSFGWIEATIITLLAGGDAEFADIVVHVCGEYESKCKSKVAKTLKRLKKKGLVESESVGRTSVYRLTGDGRKLVEGLCKLCSNRF